jgi:hypothetical protein
MQECIANGTMFKIPGTEEYVDSVYGEGRRSNFFPWGYSSAGESLVTSAQADNIGIVSDILRDGCAYLSPPSPEEKKKVAPVNASYQDIFGQTALHCAAINGNLEMVNQKKTIIEQIGGN